MPIKIVKNINGTKITISFLVKSNISIKSSFTKAPKITFLYSQREYVAANTTPVVAKIAKYVFTLKIESNTKNSPTKPLVPGKPKLAKMKIMKDIVSQFSTQDIKRFYSLASTIGAYIIFPSNMIDNKMTINAARGVNKYIKDRFDLSLLCIKYYYEGKDNPIADVLKRYSFFFDLFNG